VRLEIERADGAHTELERLRQSSNAAAVSPREAQGAEPAVHGQAAAEPTPPAVLPAAAAAAPPPPPPPQLAAPWQPPAAAAEPARHTRYARALLQRAAQRKGSAATAESIAAAKQHFDTAKQV